MRFISGKRRRRQGEVLDCSEGVITIEGDEKRGLARESLGLWFQKF
jgi:hypothetical protein